MNASFPEPASIASEKPLPTAEDFAALKASALEWLPRWCGEKWSNFNDNDSGIILLEELLYALTELGYRAALPIPTLLQADRRGGPGVLFGPTEILPMSPLTADDYARLLYDRIPALVFVAVEPITAPEESGPQGRFRMCIAVDARASATPGQVADEVQALLDRHCNLGERFDEVTVEKPSRVALELRFRLGPENDLAVAAAECVRTINSTLLPGPRFQPLADALGHETVDRVLCGPALQRGIIRDADLPRRLTWREARERISDALHASRFGHEIVTLEFLNAAELESARSNGLFVAADTLYVAQPDPVANPNEFVLRIGPSFDVTAGHSRNDIAARAERLVQSGGEKPRRDVLDDRSLISSPAAAGDDPALSLGEYFSIQHQLPTCFGLQHGAFSDETPVERGAQAAQLKGYLLPFEQLMANYLAQLAATSRLLSPRPLVRTAFAQPLTSVPDLQPLLAGEHVVGSGNRDDGASPYVAGLQAIAENSVSYATRRGRALDHLLARFNESLPTSEAATFETIANREALLHAYARIGHQRAAAADLSPGRLRERSRPRSGLEEKIQILLRRDTQADPIADAPATAGDAGDPADFYFVLEPIRFYPKPGAAATNGDFARVPLAVFAPHVFHVFVNWTLAPLTREFRAFAEARVRENAPAHLWHRFIWLETRPAPTADANEFLRRFRAWAEAGYASLQWRDVPDLQPEYRATPPEHRVDAIGRVQLVIDTPAGELFIWLRDHARKTDSTWEAVE